jgi:hypothetical protein
MAKNGQQISKENQDKFTKWVHERNTANDWHNYIYRGKIMRREIAKECNFAESVTRQNPQVRNQIEELEINLAKRGVLTPDHRPAEIKAAERRDKISSQFDKRKLNKLEQQNAQLFAENECLKEKLKHYNLFDEHLMETGRLGKL